MADYINRDSVIELSREYYSQGLKEEAVPVKAIRNIPSADVVGVRHGEWIKHENPKGVFSRECSVCHVWLEWDMPRNSFCPNCGADMRGGT